MVLECIELLNIEDAELTCHSVPVLIHADVDLLLGAACDLNHKERAQYVSTVTNLAEMSSKIG
jgi:hypothetical protein